MIYHELWSKHLRMGNWLFKYAASTALSIKHKVPSVYNDYFLWNYLEKTPWIINENPQCDRIYPTQWEWTKEEQERLDSLDYSKNIEFSLNFFFQSYKWFEGYENTIHKSLVFKYDEIEKVKKKYAHILETKPTILISTRLGDFKGHGDFFQIPMNWYERCLNEYYPDWKENWNVLVTSDHIEDAKRLLNPLFYYAEPNGTHTHADNFKHYHSEKAMEHFILGTLCDEFIISNSTFSWWQAWLGKMNGGGNVIHCGEVFSKTGNMKHCDTTHYYHPDWTKFSI